MCSLPLADQDSRTCVQFISNFYTSVYHIATATELLTNQQLYHVHLTIYTRLRFRQIFDEIALQIWREKKCEHKVIFSKYGCYLVAMIRNGIFLSRVQLWFYELWQFFSLYYRLPSSTMQAKVCLHIFEKNAIIFLQEKS